jgi:hypothetical protein
MSAGHTQPPNREALRRSLHAAAPILLLAAAFITLKTGRDALYISGDGLLALPRAYLAQAALSIPQAAGVLWLLRRFGARTARLVVLAALVALALTYFACAEPGGSWLMTLFFFLVPLGFSVGFSTTWLLGAELLESLAPRDAARAFSLVGAASILGSAAGAVVARVSGPTLGARSLLLFGCGLVALAIVAVVSTQRTFSRGVRVDARAELPRTPAMVVISRSEVRWLMAASMAAAITGVLVDFQFYVVAVGGSPATNTVFFANVYLVLAGVSLLLQLLVAPGLQRRFGVRRSLFVVPSLVLLVASTVLVRSSVAMRTGLRIVEGGLKAGLYRTTWEQTFLRLRPEHRTRAKVVVDGLAARLAEGLAGLALLIWVEFATLGHGAEGMGARWVAEVSATWITLGLTLSAAVWLSLVWALRRRLAALAPPAVETVEVLRTPPSECCPTTAALGYDEVTRASRSSGAAG